MGAKDDYGDGDEDDGDDLPKAAGLALRPCWPTTKRCPPSPGLQRQLAEFLNGILALMNSSSKYKSINHPPSKHAFIESE